MEGVTIMPTSDILAMRQDIALLKDLLLKASKEAKVKDPLLTSKELEVYLKKGSTWVDANKHNIGCCRVGGEWRFRKSQVDEYLNSTYHKNY